MPYSGPSDKSLPKNVKKLGDKARRRWVKVFNSSLSRCSSKGDEDCEAVAFRNANGTIKNASTSFVGLLGGKEALGRSFIEFTAAEPPESINIFPKPGTYKHPVWGDVEVTEEGNQEFVDNFANQVYQEHIAIDAEHEPKLSGAVGYMKELSLNEDGSVEATIDWTERGKQLIEQDGYKYISPEWFEHWQDPATEDKFDNVIVGGALTNSPFFKDLRSLVASDKHLYDLGEDDEDDRVAVVKSAIEGISYNDLQSMVLSAARHEFPSIFGHHDSVGWVVDLYDEFVIIEAGGAGYTYWRLDYEYGTDDEITFSGQPTEVQRKTIWEESSHRAKDHREHKEGNGRNKNRRKRSKPRKEGHVTKEEIEALVKQAEEMSEEERKTLFESFGASETLDITIKAGHEEEEEEDDDDSEEDTDESKIASEKVAGLTEALKTATEAREKSDKRLGVLEGEARQARMKAIILGQDEEGTKKAKEASKTLHPMVGDLASKLKVMEALGEGTPEFDAYVASEREHSDAMHAAGTFSETGADTHDEGVESTATRQFDALVKAAMEKDDKLTEGDAITKVANDPANKGLYDKADREKTGRKASFSKE